ncbi:DNA excision repair protein ERCC-6-like 2 [Peromyscus californicus insignis]|uniref:DNA excision repair protein ERCC-6-like 2 n=1 Tax=Peromyscus californicus insignis TaxID=564181 RepID=UPI0022A6BCEE|nr:DNA excision repair protein ERCC-6-like 2 [Peromyscus californicus insignis]
MRTSMYFRWLATPAKGPQSLSCGLCRHASQKRNGTKREERVMELGSGGRDGKLRSSSQWGVRVIYHPNRKHPHPSQLEAMDGPALGGGVTLKEVLQEDKTVFCIWELEKVSGNKCNVLCIIDPKLFFQAYFLHPFLQTYKNEVNAHIVIPTEKDRPPSDGSISSPLCVSYPVSQKKKDVYRTNQTTFIIGETPKGIRRKQFEEMASYYKSSVQEFARQVTSTTSEERQRMLRDFYSPQHPEVKEFFVSSASELIRSVHKAEERIKNKSREKESLSKERPSNYTLSCNEPTNKMSQVQNPKLCKGKSIRFQNHGSHREETFSSDAKIKKSSVSFTQEIDSECNDHTPKNTMTRFCPNSKSETPEIELEDSLVHQQDLTRACSSRNRPLFKLGNKRVENPVSENTPVEGLLGDTSILHDLFKSHGEGPAQLPKNVLSGPVAKAKQRPKDFWDILSEQNDDSLSKLTDLAVIETLCTKVPCSTASERKDELEASLWKANEKFLWKTFNSDDDESTANTQRE